MKRSYPIILAAAAALVLASPLLAQEARPARAYIDGVPFVSWQAMRGEEFPDSRVINPSLTAVTQMMYAYWGADFVAEARRKARPEGWTDSSGAGATLDDLKALVARGIPVEVMPATTPDAQRLYVVPAICATLQKVPYTKARPVSGSLGEMVSLEAIEQLRQGGCDTGLNDSVYVAARLVVGYDDERQVLTMHDPSFGPNLELGYEEFEAMWRAVETKYWAHHPDPLPPAAAGRAGPARARTADDEAAVALFRAYGREVIGDYAGAESLLRSALALEGLSAGRRHLLHLELAITLNETGRGLEAVEALRQASAAFPDYALTEQVLARLLATSGGGRAAKQEARKVEGRLKQLCGAEPQRRVADELGRDFHVMGCKGELLGWYRP